MLLNDTNNNINITSLINTNNNNNNNNNNPLPSDPLAPHPPSAATSAPIKRYAPPNQRSRGPNRRKSDRSERASSLHSNDWERNMGTGLRTVPSIGRSDSGSSKSLNESYQPQLVGLRGCSRSEASQLLQQRWQAAMDSYNDPSIDLSERPVMYTGSAASAWGNFRLPHQLISSPPMDFAAELERAIQNSNFNTKS